MGVGKTVQAIALASCYQVGAAGRGGPALPTRTGACGAPRPRTERETKLCALRWRRMSGRCWWSCRPRCAWCGPRSWRSGCRTCAPVASTSLRERSTVWHRWACTQAEACQLEGKNGVRCANTYRGKGGCAWQLLFWRRGFGKVKTRVPAAGPFFCRALCRMCASQATR